MKIKATHQGHCQVCNSIQKLPDAKLAKHGYKVAGYGFFVGTCPGSAHLPLEQDKGMVEWSIEWAQGIINTIQMSVECYSKPATEPKGWFHEYRPSGMGGRMPSRYVWRQVELSQTTETSSDGSSSWKSNTFISFDRRVVNLRTYSIHGDSLLEIADQLNTKYVESLQNDIKQLERYIREQRERITAWHLQPLEALADLPQPDKFVLKTPQGDYICDYTKQMGLRARYTTTNDIAEAQLFSERAAQQVMNVLARRNIKTQRIFVPSK